MRFVKRTLSAFLALVMVFTMLPLQVWASEMQQDIPDQPVTFAGIVDDRALEEVGNDVDTYIFKIDDKVVSTQYVKNGEAVYAPEAPAKEGYKFVGWFEGGTQFAAGPAANVQGMQHIYIARYQQVYYVFFMDGTGEDAAVVHTQEGVPGDAIDTAFTFNAGPDSGVEGWYYDRELTQKVQPDETIQDQNITLYPKVQTGHWLRFDANGGTPVDSVFMLPGAKTEKPTEPTREGFQFLRWETEAGEEFQFGSELTESVTLKAKWQGDTVNYKVFYWVENADDEDYSLVNTVDKTGIAGEPAVNPGDTLQLPEGYPDKNLANAVHYNAEKTGNEAEKTIAGDGSTIVNVYYDRNEYTLYFYQQGGGRGELICHEEEHTHGIGCYQWTGYYLKLTCKKAEHTHTAACYKQSSGNYAADPITGKYGASLAKMGAKWPSNTVNGRNWSTNTDGSAPWQANIETIPAKNTSFWVPDSPGWNSYDQTAYYYVEVLGNEKTDTYVGSKYYKMYDKVTVNSGYLTVSTEDRYEIQGFTLNKSDSTKVDDKYDNARFYYTRNNYTLTLVNGGSQEVKYLQYEAPLKPHLGEPAKPSGMGENFTFQGWYRDENYKVPFDPTVITKMPADNLTLYAKWDAPKFTVTVHLGMGVDSGEPLTITVPYGGKINPNDLPEIELPEGVESYSWATYRDGKYLSFDLDTPLYQDVTIYPYWVSNERFSVTYVLGENVQGEVIDSKRYWGNADADIQGLPKDFKHPEGKVFLGWKSDREGDKKLYQPGDKIQIQNAHVILKAQWGDQAVKTTLTYHANDGTGKTQSFDYYNNEEVQLKDNTDPELNFTQDGYRFLGWATSAGSKVVYHAGDAIRVNTKNAGTDNHLYAVWEQTAKQGTSITVKVLMDGQPVDAFDYVSVEKAIGTPSLTVTEGQMHTLDYTYEKLDCADFNVMLKNVPVGYDKSVESSSQTTTADDGETRTYSAKSIENGWLLDNVPGGATVTVRLTKQEFTVKYEASPAEGGTVSRYHETVRYGENAQGSTATAKDGYYFVEWQDAKGQRVDNKATFGPTNVTADATYTAVFARKTEITVRANDLSKEYDGTPITAEKAAYTANGLPMDYTLDVTYATENAPINVEDATGTLKIASVTVKNEAGQDVTDQFQITTGTGTLSIKPKPVTITVNNSKKQYGELDPEFTGEVKGLVEDDTLGVVTFTRTNTDVEAVGVYQDVLTANYTANANYEVSVDNGDFEIKQNTTEVVVTIVGSTKTEEYNGNTHTVEGYKVTSITLNDTATNLYQATDVALADDKEAKASGTNAGTYDMGLTADSFQNNNQNFANVKFVVTDGYLTITPATMTLSALGYDEMYDGSSHGGTVSGAPAGATLVYSTDGGTHWSDTAPTVKNVADGVVTVTVKATLANYQDAVETYTLNVQPRNVTLTSGDSSVPYGNTAKNEDVTVTGDRFVKDEGATYSNFASLTLVGSKDNTFDYTLNGGTLADNYTITTVPGTLTVTGAGVEDKDVVTKTHDPKEGDYKLGDTVTFTIKITNIYNEDKTLIVEERSGVAIVGDVPNTIEAGKTIELTATYRITEEDIKNGSFVNTVTVTLGDTPFKGEDTVELEDAEGALTVEKTIVEPKKEAYGLNDTIYYQIKVTNSGNVTLENITLSDVLNVGVELDAELTEGSADTLAPAASVIYTASYTVLEADLGKTIVNTATATGSYTDKDGTKTVEGEDEVPATTAAVNPDLTVEKTIINDGTFAMGETIRYKITVTNSGNQTLNNIVVTDPLTGMDETIATLAPNKTASFETSYRVTMGDVLAGKVENTATATAGDVVASDKATATITGLDSLRAEVVLNSGAYPYDGKEHTVAGGELTVKLGDAVQKGFSVEFAEGTATATDKDVLYNEKGEVIGYPVTATAGNVIIWYGGKNVTDKFVDKIDITDGELTINPKAVEVKAVDQGPVEYGTLVSKLPELTIDEDALQEQLAVGDGTASITYELAYDDTNFKDNKPLVGKHTIKFVDPLEKQGNYKVSFVPAKLTVTAPGNLDEYVVKTHEGQDFKVGDKVTFKISVTNIYAVNAKVTLEEMLGMFFGENQTTLEDELDPGETKIYTATHTLTDADFKNGGVSNTVEVTLDPEGEEPEIPGTGTDKVVLVKNPDMSVVKTVLNPKESYRVGDTIQYQITVKNTGNVTLHDLELTDVMNADGKVTFPAGTDLTRKTLNVGDSWTVTCSYVVREADEGKKISNKATVIAHDPETKDPEKEAGDTTDGEQVQNLYSLTIHYRNGAGNAVAGSYSARYHVGDSFKIVSPIVAGYYDPQIRSISPGPNGMPAQDLEFVVIYTAIPVPAPDPGPGPAPNPGPGPGPAPNPGPDDGDDDDDTPPVPNPEQEQPPQPQDFEIDPDDYTLTELEDNETPLANLDLDGHTCCILHLLLMLAAMVVLGFYTKSRKKHQARIFELKRILAAEEDHPDDPQQP